MNEMLQKLAVGDIPEKIMTAMHAVHDESGMEDTALNNCEAAVRRFGNLERDIETQGNKYIDIYVSLDKLL